jgi:AcrR family transcriptional regulator
MARVRDPKETRRRILGAAREEFWRNGYRAGSLNGIVEAAGVTKGALFHHFRDKQALALAVLEEVLAPEWRQHWIEPMESSGAGEDVLQGLGRLLAGELERIEMAGDEGPLVRGAALVHFASDLGEADEVLRERVGELFDEWHGAVAHLLAQGQTAGSVHPNITPDDEAAFLVSMLAGVSIVGKSTRRISFFQAAFRAATAYLETLRAPSA